MGVRPLSGFVPQQAYFDFLPAIIVANLTQKNLASIHRADRMRERGPRIPAPRPLSPEESLRQIPLQLLDAPIGIGELSSLELPPAILEMREVQAAQGEEVEENDSVGDDFHWSDGAVAQLHEGLLFSSLASLSASGNSVEKVETLMWFYRPDIYCWRPVTQQGVQVYRPVYASTIPFTFQRCCALLGLDFTDMRDRLSYILRKAGLGQYLPE